MSSASDRLTKISSRENTSRLESEAKSGFNNISMQSLPTYLKTSLLAVVMALMAPTAEAIELFGATEGEYIILSGGPALREWEGFRSENHRHDRWWGNFVRAARIRMQQLTKEKGPKQDITWMVYRTGYEKRGVEDGVDHISNVISVRDRDDVECKLIWFTATDQLINYLNNGPSGRSRNNYKITGFEYFGHSNKYCFTFDYSGEVLGASKVFLHEDDLKRLKRGIFSRRAYCQSWGCHTGESMSQVWRRATGVKMRGAIGKTDYSECWRQTLPVISTAGGRWSY